MAHHVVGYALNEVIELFEREGLWNTLGLERSRQLVLKMLEIARRNDCGSGDVLQDIGPRFQICAECLGRADGYRELLCPECYAGWYEHTFKKKPPP